VAPDPIHRKVEVILVTTLRHEIEEVVSSHKNVEPARVRGIGVKNVAVLVLVEDAQPGKLIRYIFSLPIVVIGFVLLLVFLRERDVVIKIEIVAVR